MVTKKLVEASKLIGAGEELSSLSRRFFDNLKLLPRDIEVVYKVDGGEAYLDFDDDFKKNVTFFLRNTKSGEAYPVYTVVFEHHFDQKAFDREDYDNTSIGKLTKGKVISKEAFGVEVTGKLKLTMESSFQFMYQMMEWK